MIYRRHFFRSTIRIVSLMLIGLVVYVVLFSGETSQHDGFDINDIRSALEQHEKVKREYQLTGIILHWQRLSGVKNLVRTMLDYDDIFTHILIWNNNPKKNLTHEDILIDNDDKDYDDRIEIINAGVNIKDQAKYQACARARTRACFYVDDDWDIRLYARSLYSSYLLEPTILHAITDQFTYFTNLMWTFFDNSIDLHTGFSWIGCGSIFSRNNAIRHLKYLNIFLQNEENQDLIPQSDQFFSIWMNQLPAQFNGRLVHSDEGAASSFENFDFDTLQYRASVLAIQTLERILRHYRRSTLFTRERASNSLVTLTKSPCSYNDRFIFFTNCLPIDHLEEIPFNITLHYKRSTRANLPHANGSPYRDDVKFFEQFNTANAVDNDTQTCWKINRSTRSGDFYGIDFQTIDIHGNRSFAIIYRHRTSLQKNLEISISLDSEKWISLPREHRQGIIYKKGKKRVTFKVGLFPEGYRVFRFIRFIFVGDDHGSFHVCEVRLLN